MFDTTGWDGEGVYPTLIHVDRPVFVDGLKAFFGSGGGLMTGSARRQDRGLSRGSVDAGEATAVVAGSRRLVVGRRRNGGPQRQRLFTDHDAIVAAANGFRAAIATSRLTGSASLSRAVVDFAHPPLPYLSSFTLSTFP